jgi:hypothetical protein
MLLSSFARHAMSGLAIVAALDACSAPLLSPANAGSAFVDPNRSPSSIRVSDSRCDHKGVLPPCGLLYVTDYYADAVQVYRDDALVGTLTGFRGPDGICNDRSGDVWITNNLGASVVEYAHGATAPTAKLRDPKVYPLGCSVDPTTGNLAVANIYATNGTHGSVAIYAGAQGSPAYYSDPEMYYVYFCGYDGSGNLFVDGRNTSGGFQFAELPKGSSTFRNITLSGGTIYFPGNVFWDGTYVAVGDQQYQSEASSAIYRTTGAGGQIVSVVQMLGAQDVIGFYIFSPTRSLIAPDAALNDVGLYKYPRGGVPTNKIAGFDGPFGAAISR